MGSCYPVTLSESSLSLPNGHYVDTRPKDGHHALTWTPTDGTGITWTLDGTAVHDSMNMGGANDGGVLMARAHLTGITWTLGRRMGITL